MSRRRDSKNPASNGMYGYGIGIILIIGGFIFVNAKAPAKPPGSGPKQHEKAAFPEKTSSTQSAAKNEVATPLSPDCQDALKSMRFLQSKATVGVSYADFMKTFHETKFKVDEWVKSPEATQRKDLAAAMREAIGLYEVTKLFWDAKITERNGSVQVHGWVKSAIYGYPKLKSAVFSLGERYGDAIDLNMATGIMLQLAGEAVTKANDMAK